MTPVRIVASYGDASVGFDTTQRRLRERRPGAHRAELARQKGIGSHVPEAELLLLANHDASPEHFIAATWALRGPDERPVYKMTGVEPVPDTAQAHATSYRFRVDLDG